MESNDNSRARLDMAAKAVRQGIAEGSPLYPVLNGTLNAPRPSRLGRYAASNAYFPRTEALSRADVQIGAMPPQPPSLRARVGAVLVAIVRRALFWYTAQIQAFQTRVAEAAAEQTRVLARLSGQQQEQATLLAKALARIEELERHTREEQENIRALFSELSRQMESQSPQSRDSAGHPPASPSTETSMARETTP